jgi:amino acid permease
VFLLTGIASILVVLTNRLARIVDRSRLAQQLPAAPAEQAQEYRWERHLIARRIRINYIAIGLCIGSALLVCSVIALLFIGSLLAAHLQTVVAVLFIVCMATLVAALSGLLGEVYLGTRQHRYRESPDSPRQGYQI